MFWRVRNSRRPPDPGTTHNVIALYIRFQPRQSSVRHLDNHDGLFGGLCIGENVTKGSLADLEVAWNCVVAASQVMVPVGSI